MQEEHIDEDVEFAGEYGVPLGQAEQLPAPPKLKVPGVHNTAVPFVEPAGHANPAAQGPVQLAVIAPGTEPYRPAAQELHSPLPPALYVPTGHNDTIEEIEPAGQAYPALQGPEHADDTIPAVDPNLPAGQGPLQPSENSADTSPYRPARQDTQTPVPGELYVPGLHCTGVLLVLPSTQTYPAEQVPEHDEFVSPDVAPYSPAAQKMQDDAPCKLYVPGEHIAAVALVDPALHTYPALHDPLHDAVDKPDVAPYKPDAHMLHVPDPAIEYCPAGHSTAVALADPDGHAYPALHAPVH